MTTRVDRFGARLAQTVAASHPTGAAVIERHKPLASLISSMLKSRAVRWGLPCLVTGGLVVVLFSKRGAFAEAVTTAPVWFLACAVVLQLGALLARSEAWRLCVEATGSTVTRRPVFHASGIGGLVGVINAPSGVAARIATLRGSAPNCPKVSSLVTAEVPILAVEATLAALASFTLLGPLNLAWWVPVLCAAVSTGAIAMLTRLARRRTTGPWSGLAVLRTAGDRGRIVGLVLLAVGAQIARNWLALHAIGVDASVFDATAVLIAMVTLSQLPIGPSVGAAAVVLILGTEGPALAAAAGVLLSATGVVGTLTFGGWALADRARRVRPAGFAAA